MDDVLTPVSKVQDPESSNPEGKDVNKAAGRSLVLSFDEMSLVLGKLALLHVGKVSVQVSLCSLHIIQ